VCKEPFVAQRSTRKFCEVACRVKFHRDHGARTKREGLRPAQIRILRVLSELRTGLYDLAKIARAANISRGWLSDLVGQKNETKRAAREAKTGIVSLLTLRYVVLLEVPTDLRKERLYPITDKGREALAAITS
jgi:DNA-binding MarR family transcriptional regulator